MTTVTLSLLSSNPGSIVWANPNKLDDTLRFKRTMSTKDLNGVKLTNVRQELIANRNVHTKHCKDECGVQEALSVRTSISGSFEAKEDVLNMLDTHIANLTAFKAAAANYGFDPSGFSPEFIYSEKE